jgi:hypothetical protein
MIEDEEVPDDIDQEMMDAKIEAFAEAILSKRSEAIEFRAACGVEKRWKVSERLIDYASDETDRASMMDYASGEAMVRSRGPRRSRVTMNVVRGRCETAEGRFSDTMLPVDDKNWALKVTPKPRMRDMQEDDRPAMQQGQPITDAQGKPATMRDVASDIRARAEKAMRGMELEIEDQLTECDFNGECRKMIASAAKLGTGILKGPSVVKSVKRTWEEETGTDEDGFETKVYVINQSEDNQPASKNVSVWNVYPSPDCGEDVAKASYIWEKDTIRPREVRDKIGLPGYNESRLRKVLDEDPKRTSLTKDSRSNQYRVQSDQLTKGNLYEIWEYHGDVSREDMELLGCECPDQKTVSACVVFINDHPVKAALNTLDTGDLPYDFFQWSKISDEPWGVGIPYMMMWSQRVIDAAWRAMMDNAGDSAGVNIAINGLEPDDGVWEITGKKIWRPDAESEIEDVRKAIAQFQITNNQEPLQRIIELTLRFIDLETSIPTIFNGEAQEVPETLGATNIMVDSANTSLRNRIKRYDDQVTRRHLRRYYDWNMQYNENNDIKGDFDVDPRGVSVLYEKDQQAQLLLQVFQLKADPDIARKTDWDKAIEQFYSSRRLNILKDEQAMAAEEQAAAQQQQGPGNPALEVAQVRVHGELEKATMVQQSDMAELQFKAKEAELERQHQARMKEMDLQQKMMEFAEKRNLKIDELKTQLALGSAGMNLQRELSDKKMTTPEVATPPTEPSGRAPQGQGYQR